MSKSVLALSCFAGAALIAVLLLRSRDADVHQARDPWTSLPRSKAATSSDPRETTKQIVSIEPALAKDLAALRADVHALLELERSRLPMDRPAGSAAEWTRIVNAAQDRLAADEIARGKAYLLAMLPFAKKHLQESQQDGDENKVVFWRSEVSRYENALAQVRDGKLRTLEDVSKWLATYHVEIH